MAHITGRGRGGDCNGARCEKKKWTRAPLAFVSTVRQSGFGTDSTFFFFSPHLFRARHHLFAVFSNHGQDQNSFGIHHFFKLHFFFFDNQLDFPNANWFQRALFPQVEGGNTPAVWCYLLLSWDSFALSGEVSFRLERDSLKWLGCQARDVSSFSIVSARAGDVRTGGSSAVTILILYDGCRGAGSPLLICPDRARRAWMIAGVTSRVRHRERDGGIRWSGRRENSRMALGKVLGRVFFLLLLLRLLFLPSLLLDSEHRFWVSTLCHVTSVLREMADGTFHSLRAADLFPPQRWVVTGQKHQTGLGHRRLEDADQSRSLWPGVSTLGHSRTQALHTHARAWLHRCTRRPDTNKRSTAGRKKTKRHTPTHTPRTQCSWNQPRVFIEERRVTGITFVSQNALGPAAAAACRQRRKC